LKEFGIIFAAFVKLALEVNGLTFKFIDNGRL
jgi:hypothetical protein